MNDCVPSIGSMIQRRPLDADGLAELLTEHAVLWETISRARPGASPPRADRRSSPGSVGFVLDGERGPKMLESETTGGVGGGTGAGELVAVGLRHGPRA